MSATHTSGGNLCPNCGEYFPYGNTHYCGSWPRGPGAFTPIPLTSDDVRRIVREELERALKEPKP